MCPFCAGDLVEWSNGLSAGPSLLQVQLTLEDRIDRRPTGTISFHVHVTPSAIAGAEDLIFPVFMSMCLC